MGLAAPRNKTKISADPRNTHWASNTANFGHRILTSHGWAPGSTLGDTSSSYHASGHITEASNTGVKIVLKGDNLGIGCKGGVKDDECTGLDLFQDLLGRLNGKEEEVEKRVQRRKMELVSGRYGMKFVRGETYVSSDIDKLLEDIGKMEEGKAEAAKEKKREERRRRKNERKAAKASKAEQESQVEESSASPPAEELTNKEEKGKREKEKKPKKSGSSTPAPTSSSDPESKSKKRKRGDNAKKSKKSKRDKRDKKDGRDKRGRSKESSDIETPALTSGTVTPTALTGRHAIRHRYIAAKRSAVMDTKALNEILMIKA